MHRTNLLSASIVVWLLCVALSALPARAGTLPAYRADQTPPTTIVDPSNYWPRQPRQSPIPGRGDGGHCAFGSLCGPAPPPSCGPVCVANHAGESRTATLARFGAAAGCDPNPAPPPQAPQPPAPQPPEPPAQACTAAWRIDDSFLRKSEGALITRGYVPTNTKTGKVIGNSGVTISTGVDLGQQTDARMKEVLESYESAHPEVSIDVNALVAKFDPYYKKHKEDAVAALAAHPLEISKQEAQVLANAFLYDQEVSSASKFDETALLGMNFEMLPEAAQTVIIDFTYQYGLSETNGSIRATFWEYVNNGEWKKLKEWLGITENPNLSLEYSSRRAREGDELAKALASGVLPEVGNPCSS